MLFGLCRVRGDILWRRKRKVHEGDAFDKRDGETMDQEETSGQTRVQLSNMILYWIYTVQVDGTFSFYYDSLSCSNWSRSTKFTEMGLPFHERATVPRPCLKICTKQGSSGNPTTIPMFTCICSGSPYHPPPRMLHLFLGHFTHSSPPPRYWGRYR